jgi:hypothetical protein
MMTTKLSLYSADWAAKTVLVLTGLFVGDAIGYLLSTISINFRADYLTYSGKFVRCDAD